MNDDKILDDDTLIAANDEIDRLETIVVTQTQIIKDANLIIEQSLELLGLERDKMTDHAVSSARKKKRERPPKGN